MQPCRRYVVISPCRDEANYMRQTLDSVVAQSIRPARWIIVDDGSTDETPQILAEYRARHNWIEVVTRSDRGRRSVGPGVIDAFYAGYETINPDDYDYLCKLDLDLRLPPRYFELLMQRMTEDPRIATCSGKAYIEENGSLVPERHGDDMSLGMTKFYRVPCFKAIGGFVREVMWDGIDCHRCRMHGWIACSWDEPDLRFVHLRPDGLEPAKHLRGTHAPRLWSIFHGYRICVHGGERDLPAESKTLFAGQRRYAVGLAQKRDAAQAAVRRCRVSPVSATVSAPRALARQKARHRDGGRGSRLWLGHVSEHFCTIPPGSGLIQLLCVEGRALWRSQDACGSCPGRS